MLRLRDRSSKRELLFSIEVSYSHETACLHSLLNEEIDNGAFCWNWHVWLPITAIRYNRHAVHTNLDRNSAMAVRSTGACASWSSSFFFSAKEVQESRSVLIKIQLVTSLYQKSWQYLRHRVGGVHDRDISTYAAKHAILRLQSTAETCVKKTVPWTESWS